MFKHLLLSTDGLLPPSGMIGKCIALGKETGAQVTGVHVFMARGACCWAVKRKKC